MDEFMDYYNNLSFCIESDEVFNIMINNVWNITGGGYALFNYNHISPENPMYRFMDERRSTPSSS